MGREKRNGRDTPARKRSANRLRQLRESTALTGRVVTLTRRYCLRLRELRAAGSRLFLAPSVASLSLSLSLSTRSPARDVRLTVKSGSRDVQARCRHVAVTLAVSLADEDVSLSIISDHSHRARREGCSRGNSQRIQSASRAFNPLARGNLAPTSRLTRMPISFAHSSSRFLRADR